MIAWRKDEDKEDVDYKRERNPARGKQYHGENQTCRDEVQDWRKGASDENLSGDKSNAEYKEETGKVEAARLDIIAYATNRDHDDSIKHDDIGQAAGQDVAQSDKTPERQAHQQQREIHELVFRVSFEGRGREVHYGYSLRLFLPAEILTWPARQAIIVDSCGSASNCMTARASKAATG